MLAIAGQMARPNGLALFQRKINFFYKIKILFFQNRIFLNQFFFFQKSIPGATPGTWAGSSYSIKININTTKSRRIFKFVFPTTSAGLQVVIFIVNCVFPTFFSFPFFIFDFISFLINTGLSLSFLVLSSSWIKN